MRWTDASGPGLSRAGGAGPSDHKAIQIGEHILMVPIFTHSAAFSPYSARIDGRAGAVLLRHDKEVAQLHFPQTPRFYDRKTVDGIPYWKIATLHAGDVLATTVLQTCTRFGNRETSCQFCAIGQSLAAKKTIPKKSPAQLAEVAKAAVELDGVKHMVMTTGTPETDDRGAALLADCARAIREAVPLPLQAQCEPPEDFSWFQAMADAGVDSLGLHLEAVSERVRARIMPGKAEVSVARYFEAFAEAVQVFGRGQVSTYILAGLGDTEEEILETSERLIDLGVYPFVVPFVPISGTPLAHHAQPDPAFLNRLLTRLSTLLESGNLRSTDVKAGCAKCGACSSLRAREKEEFRHA